MARADPVSQPDSVSLPPPPWSGLSSGGQMLRESLELQEPVFPWQSCSFTLHSPVGGHSDRARTSALTDEAAASPGVKRSARTHVHTGSGILLSR